MQDRNDAIKLRIGCVDCGWNGWARGLEWDHVRGTKLTTISIMIANGMPWTAIEEEMAKCELVCANCHRIRTEKRSRESGAYASATTSAVIGAPAQSV